MRTTDPFHRTGEQRRALTLLDLILTLFIIGLFAAVAFPRYGHHLTSFQADALAKQIAADFQFARRRAKLQASSQEVQFDLAANRYLLPGIRDLDNPESPYVVELASSGSAATLLAASFGSSGSDTTVAFDIYGCPDAGGSVLIEVSGHQRTIVLDSVTGLVEIQP